MTRSPRELATQKNQLRKQQEKLLRDLLAVVDDLDRAAEHWQQAEQRQLSEPSNKSSKRLWWQRWRQWFGLLPAEATQVDNLTEVVTSAREGVTLIRESMLAVLSEHQVESMPAQGEPFDPTQMHALGQQIDGSVPPNTVIQEVVRGYRWKERTLREAQVIVAVAPAEKS